MRHDLKFIGKPPGGANLKEIEALELDLACRLPPDYREFLLERNGGHLAEENNIFVSPRDGREYRVDFLYSVGSSENEANSIREALWLAQGRLPKNFLPIGRDLGGWKVGLVLKGPADGSVYSCRLAVQAGAYEDPEEFMALAGDPKDPEFNLLARCFGEFLDGLRP